MSGGPRVRQAIYTKILLPIALIVGILSSVLGLAVPSLAVGVGRFVLLALALLSWAGVAGWHRSYGWRWHTPLRTVSEQD